MTASNTLATYFNVRMGGIQANIHRDEIRALQHLSIKKLEKKSMIKATEIIMKKCFKYETTEDRKKTQLFSPNYDLVSF